MSRTVTFVRRLRPYSILKGDHTEDPFVREIFEDVLDEETLSALDDYTRGLYDLDLHYESFLFYDRLVETDQLYGERIRQHPSLQNALTRLRADLSELHGLEMIRPDNLDSVIWNPTTSAGFGYVGIKRDNYYLARRNATRALYDFGKYRHLYRFVPDKAFARSQLALKVHPKIRHVWGRAFHHILLEGCIAQPIIEQLLTTDTPIFIGKDIHKDMPACVLALLTQKATVYCLDFSKFDSSVNTYLIYLAWELIKEMFVFRDHVDALLFDFVVYLFCNVPLIMPDGRLFNVTTGVPSGSYFTQIIDSIVNLIVIYMLQDTYNCIAPTKVLGDDSIFASPVARFNFAEAHAFFRQFGMTLSDKTVITTNVAEIIFLGHNFYGSRVTRDEFTCLSLALFTEEEVPSPAYSILRVTSLVYDSGFNSFGLFNLLKKLHAKYDIDWTTQIQRPVTVRAPYYVLFILG